MTPGSIAASACAIRGKRTLAIALLQERIPADFLVARRERGRLAVPRVFSASSALPCASCTRASRSRATGRSCSSLELSMTPLEALRRLLEFAARDMHARQRELRLVHVGRGGMLLLQLLDQLDRARLVIALQRIQHLEVASCWPLASASCT